MIAELYGKISSRGTNLTETLEDNLTGNFFGTLRYIPFSKGIQKILATAIKENIFNEYESEEWSDKIIFWPYHKDGELDLVIQLNSVTIGIEVKYNSGLSSDDEVINDDKKQEKSRNQLARESGIIKEFAEVNGTKPILLFIARQNEGKEIYEDVKNRNIIEQGVLFKFISWEEICLAVEELGKSTELTYFEKIVIEDLHKLLVKKGFDRFKDFKSNMDIELVIKDKFYMFDTEQEVDISLCEDNKKIKFVSDIKIEEDGYYEFI